MNAELSCCTTSPIEKLVCWAPRQRRYPLDHCFQRHCAPIVLPSHAGLTPLLCAYKVSEEQSNDASQVKCLILKTRPPSAVEHPQPREVWFSFLLQREGWRCGQLKNQQQSNNASHVSSPSVERVPWPMWGVDHGTPVCLNDECQFSVFRYIVGLVSPHSYRIIAPRHGVVCAPSGCGRAECSLSTAMAPGQISSWARESV